MRSKRKPTPPLRLAELGRSLHGYFELRVDRIVGWVKDIHESSVDSMRVDFVRRGQVVASSEATWEPTNRRYVFGFPVEGRFTAAELVREDVIAIACDSEGTRGRVLLDGATQLELIRAHMGRPAAEIIDLDFSQGGNARPYLGEGWSGTERNLTWTEGEDSTIQFATPGEAGTYSLSLTIGAHIRRPQLSAQMLVVFVNSTQIALRSFTEVYFQFHAFDFSHEAFGAGLRTTLRLHHPDAARPSDFGEPDSRQLAFCVKRLTLVRLLVS